MLVWFAVSFFGIGVFFWALAVGHAGGHYRQVRMQEHARAISDEMAERENGE